MVEFCCLVPPGKAPIWASKVNGKKEDGTRDWGTWQKCEAPNDITGFASLGQREPSEKQRNWWSRSAAHFGLDPTQELTKKCFQALPVLKDTGERL